MCFPGLLKTVTPNKASYLGDGAKKHGRRVATRSCCCGDAAALGPPCQLAECRQHITFQSGAQGRFCCSAPAQ